MARSSPGAGLTALITGASSGIGEALARRFARAGFNLVLVARSADKLEELANSLAKAFGVKTWVAPADLAQPGAAQKLAAAMKRARRPIDVLVNNAGVLEYGAFVGTRSTRHRELIDLNVTALSELLAHFVPPMVARGQGRVLNVASIAAFQPVPMLATYAATKAFVLSLTESLPFSSELGGLPAFVVGNAESVADEGYEACMKAEVIRVPGALNLAAAIAGRSTPRWLLRRLSGAMIRRMKPRS